MYKRQVQEKAGQNKYVTYDNTSYTVSVQVADGGDGQLYVDEVRVNDVEAYKAEGSAPGMKDGSVNLTEAENANIIFRNSYEAKASLTVRGTKGIVSQDGAVLLPSQVTDTAFTMKLQQTDDTYQPLQGGTELSASTSVQVGQGLGYGFAPITYTQESLLKADGTYADSADFYYLVTEEAKNAGYEANTQSYRLHVVLSRETDPGDTNGSLKLAVERDGAEATPTSTLTDKTTEYTVTGQNFTNTYKAAGHLELKGKKKLRGLNLADGLFKFEVHDSENALVAQGTNKNGNTGDIEFTEVGSGLSYDSSDIGKTFNYTVTEGWDDSLTNAGYSQVGDNRHTLAVTVADAGNGVLKLTAVVDGEEEKTVTSGEDGTASITDGTWLDFENKYSIDAISAELVAYKSVNGRTNLADYTEAAPKFTFSLYEADYSNGEWKTGAVVDAGVEVDLASHEAKFAPIEYGAEALEDPENPGNYLEELTRYYLIKEDELDDATTGKQFTGSDKMILARVDLYKDTSAKLQLKLTYANDFATFDPNDEGMEDQYGPDKEQSIFHSENVYSMLDNTYTNNLALDLEGVVALDSSIRDMTDQSFTVSVVKKAANTSEQDSTLATLTVGGGDEPGTPVDSSDETSAKGLGYEAEGLLAYSGADVGKTYTYEVTQVKMTKPADTDENPETPEVPVDYVRKDNQFEGAAGYTADQTVYTITVTVGVDAQGNLTADYSVVDADGEETGRGQYSSASNGETDGETDRKISGLDFTNRYAASVEIHLAENTTFRAEAGADTTVQQWLTTNSEAGFGYRVYRMDGENDIPQEGAEREVLVGVSDTASSYAEAQTQQQDGTRTQSLKEATSLNSEGNSYTDKSVTEETRFYYVEQTIPAGVEDDIWKGLHYGFNGTDTVHAYIVKVTVSDNDGVDGTLNVSYEKKEVSDDAAYTSENGSLLTFVNTYAAAGTVNLYGTKKLDKRNLAAGDFSFELSRKEGATGEADSALGAVEGGKLTTVNAAAQAGVASDAFQWKLPKEAEDGDACLLYTSPSPRD